MNSFLLGIALGAMSVSGTASQDNIAVHVNGSALQLQSQQPMQWYTRVLVPLKDVMDHLGGSTKWNSRTLTVTARMGERSAHVKIGRQIADVDGKQIWMDVAPRTVNGTTMVPLRFFDEAFGAKTEWNDVRRIASIDLPDRGGARTASSDATSGRPSRAETPERRQYRSQVPTAEVSDYERFLVEQDFRAYQSDRARWIQNFQNYRAGLLSNGSRGDFEVSDSYTDYLRQRDFETYTNNLSGWRGNYRAFIQWRRTMSAVQRSPAFQRYLEDRRGLTAQTDRLIERSGQGAGSGAGSAERSPGTGTGTPPP